MRDAMLGRDATPDAGLDGRGARGFSEVGRAGDAGGGRMTRGAGGLATLGGNGKPPTARARVGLGAVGDFFNGESDLVTPLRALRLILPWP